MGSLNKRTLHSRQSQKENRVLHSNFAVFFGDAQRHQWTTLASGTSQLHIPSSVHLAWVPGINEQKRKSILGEPAKFLCPENRQRTAYACKPPIAHVTAVMVGIYLVTELRKEPRGQTETWEPSGPVKIANIVSYATKLKQKIVQPSFLIKILVWTARLTCDKNGRRQRRVLAWPRPSSPS